MQFEQAKKYILARLRDELPPHLSYHSVAHVKDVYKACKQLAEAEGVEGENLTLLLTAALYHDSGFLVNQKNHEEISCNIVQEQLPGFSYTDTQIGTICGMIRATKIPQQPGNLLEQILADADLDYLGRDDFFVIGDRLFEELSMYGFLSSEDEWNKLQVRFMEAHHYFTETAMRLRLKGKNENLAKVKKKVD